MKGLLLPRSAKIHGDSKKLRTHPRTRSLQWAGTVEMPPRSWLSITFFSKTQPRREDTKLQLSVRDPTPS